MGEPYLENIHITHVPIYTHVARLAVSIKI